MKKWIYLLALFFLVSFVGLGVWKYYSGKSTAITFFGKVVSWDPEKRELIALQNYGTINQMFIIDPYISSVITFLVTASGDYTDVPIITTASQDWLTAFCAGDKLRIDFNKNKKGEYEIVEVRNQGPRLCK